jgi:hypothetical protein
MKKNEINISEKEISASNKKIGYDTNIKLTVKTAIAIISGLWLLLSTVAGWIYFDLKKEIKANNEKFEKQKIELMEKIDNKLEIFKDKMNNTDINIETIKGDIKVILDRDMRNNNGNRDNIINVKNIKPPSD